MPNLLSHQFWRILAGALGLSLVGNFEQYKHTVLTQKLQCQQPCEWEYCGGGGAWGEGAGPLS